ncbi:hypothetical protein EW145_g693 [Phellinidium pouzarii]|uniref:HMG box domain-containing protein n=1 Tax=Phellinidium pouzarii TaxID=167371 RepID=A0A4S4LHY5_9AGAM|nr:hypothetical protein EW145_g693 [Phellinidium pouzarii]
MARDVCSIRISGLRDDLNPTRHSPYQKSVSQVDDFPFPSLPLETPASATIKCETMSPPPHTPPALSHSVAATPCTSAEPSPTRANTNLPVAESVLPTPLNSRKKTTPHVKRPPNSFILFACEYRKGHKGKNNRELSKQAGALWRLLSPADKQTWKDRYAIVKEKHLKANPGYRYQPRRREKVVEAQRDVVETIMETPTKSFPNALTFPKTPTSMPRKKAASRDIYADTPVCDEEDNAPFLHESLLASPTFRASRHPREIYDFIDLTQSKTPPKAPRLTLPPSSHPSPETTNSTIICPSSITSHIAAPTSSVFSTDNTYLPQQWTLFPQQINQQWTNVTSTLPNLAGAVWNDTFEQHLVSKTAQPSISTPVNTKNEESMFFSQLVQPTFGFGNAF